MPMRLNRIGEKKIWKNANVVEKKSANKTAKATMDYAGNAGTTN